MRSPLLPLNTAIGDRIELDTGREVHGSTPKNEKFPYISLGNKSAKDWSEKSTSGQRVFFTVDIWSQYHGDKEILGINDEIIQALTRAPLDLGGRFNAVCENFDDNKIIDDLDGKTRHGIITFEYLIEER